MGGRQAAERPERDGVISPEDERNRARIRLLDDLRGDPLAGLLDLRQEACPLVAKRRCLRDRRLDVPVVAHAIPEAREPLLEPCVAHGGRPHVYSAAALAEIEGCTDDRDIAFAVARHGAEGYAILAA